MLFRIFAINTISVSDQSTYSLPVEVTILPHFGVLKGSAQILRAPY